MAATCGVGGSQSLAMHGWAEWAPRWLDNWRHWLELPSAEQACTAWPDFRESVDFKHGTISKQGGTPSGAS